MDISTNFLLIIILLIPAILSILINIWLKTIIENIVWNYAKLFIVLLASIFNASTQTKFVRLTNQKCKIQPALTYLQPNDYKQDLKTVFFYIWKCWQGFIKKKQRKTFKKGSKSFWRRKNKSATRLVSDTETVLKNKKKRSANIIVNYIKSFRGWKTKISWAYKKFFEFFWSAWSYSRK